MNRNQKEKFARIEVRVKPKDKAKIKKLAAKCSLISTVVERIFITTENDKRVCHIFVKGCTTENYTDLFGAAEYIADNNNPLIFNMRDSEQCREYYMILAAVL